MFDWRCSKEGAFSRGGNREKTPGKKGAFSRGSNREKTPGKKGAFICLNSF
jgi:hypothetical protein